MNSFANNLRSSTPPEYGSFFDSSPRQLSSGDSPHFQKCPLDEEGFSPEFSPSPQDSPSVNLKSLDLDPLPLMLKDVRIQKKTAWEGENLTISRTASCGFDPYATITRLFPQLPIVISWFTELLEQTGEQKPGSSARMHKCFECWSKAEELNDGQLQCLRKVADHRQATKVLLLSANEKQLNNYFLLMASALNEDRNAWCELLGRVKSEVLPNLDNQELVEQLEVSVNLGLKDNFLDSENLRTTYSLSTLRTSPAPDYGWCSLDEEGFTRDFSPSPQGSPSVNPESLDLDRLSLMLEDVRIEKRTAWEGENLTISRTASCGPDPYATITRLFPQLPIVMSWFTELLEQTGEQKPGSSARMHKCFECWSKEDEEELNDGHLQCLRKVADHRQATKVLLLSANEKQLNNYFLLMASALNEDRNAWREMLGCVKSEVLPNLDNQELLEQLKVWVNLGLKDNFLDSENLRTAYSQSIHFGKLAEESRRLDEDKRRLKAENLALQLQLYENEARSKLKNWSCKSIPEDESAAARTIVLNHDVIDALLQAETSIDTMHYFSVMSKCLEQKQWKEHLQLIWNKIYDILGSEEKNGLAKVLAGLIMNCGDPSFPETGVSRDRSLLKEFVELFDRERLHKSVPALHGPWWERLQVLIEDSGSSEGSSCQEESPLSRLKELFDKKAGSTVWGRVHEWNFDVKLAKFEIRKLRETLLKGDTVERCVQSNHRLSRLANVFQLIARHLETAERKELFQSLKASVIDNQKGTSENLDRILEALIDNCENQGDPYTRFTNDHLLLCEFVEVLGPSIATERLNAEELKWIQDFSDNPDLFNQ